MKSKKVPNKNILLTEDLRKKVEQRLKKDYAVAEKHYKTKFKFPEIRYDIKSHVGGMAFYQLDLIRLNLILLVENEDHYVSTTVPHEAAHLIAYQIWTKDKSPNRKKLMPHGALWKEVMGVLGVPPNVKHTYDCASIEKFVSRKVRAVRVDRVSRVLKQILNFTQDERMQLREALRG